MKQTYIYDAIRTPRGRAKQSGALHDCLPHDLLLQLYRALEHRTGLDPALVGEVILGCVTQYGEQAANIAKTSSLYAGWPASVGGLTVNRFCSSSIDAVNIASLKIGAGQESAVVAGGVEMMSRVPMLADQATVFVDPQFAAQAQILMMGSGADLIASLCGVSREQADAIACESHRRAERARVNGWFPSIIPIQVPGQSTLVSEDECIRSATTLSSLARLQPAFAELGLSGADRMQLQANPSLAAIEHIHTAGNSPAMADAASLVLLGNEAFGSHLQRSPRARVVAATTASADPLQVLSGCVAATQRLLTEQKLSVADVDLFEVHEAFAATVVKCQRELKLDSDRLNVNGGVIALGHPMGATGTIMLGTLLDELERRDLHRGIVAASGAAGAGSALLIERIQ